MIHPASRPFLVVVHGPEPAGVSRTSVSFISPVKAAGNKLALLLSGLLGCLFGGLFGGLGSRFFGRRLLGSLLFSHGSDLRPIGAGGLASTIEAMTWPPIPPWHTDNYPATHDCLKRCFTTMSIHALLSLVLYCILKKFQSPSRVIFSFFFSLALVALFDQRVVAQHDRSRRYQLTRLFSNVHGSSVFNRLLLSLRLAKISCMNHSTCLKRLRPIFGRSIDP